MDVNIASPEHKADPYPFYARLRGEAPVARVTLPDRQTAWLVTRYDDVAAALKDERLVKDKSRALSPDQARRQPWVPGLFRPLMRNMLDLDPPDHTRLRALVHRAFTPRLVEQMRGRIQALADELLDRIRTAPPRFFEQLVIDLLVTMGYGGFRADAGQAVGGSGDDGVDGIIKEDRLGLDFVYVQAKR